MVYFNEVAVVVVHHPIGAMVKMGHVCANQLLLGGFAPNFCPVICSIGTMINHTSGVRVWAAILILLGSPFAARHGCHHQTPVLGMLPLNLGKINVGLVRHCLYVGTCHFEF